MFLMIQMIKISKSIGKEIFPYAFLLCFPLSLEKLILEVMRLRIRKSVDLKVLEEYHYFYQENLIFPTYRKVIKQGKGSVVIEIVVETRCLFIN